MKTAVVICPGRGIYTKTGLGYPGRHFADMRKAHGQNTLTALDGAARYSVAKHTRGDNASGLIYRVSVEPRFVDISHQKFDSVFVV